VTLHRAMGFWDLVLFYIAAVVSLRWVANISTLGPSALVVWLIAFVGLFLPLSFAVAELSSRYPEEGGIYVWSKQAFGDFHGFMTGYTYWTSNLVYFPSLLFYAAGSAAYVIPKYSGLAKNQIFLITFELAGLTVALLLNLVGLRVGKWLHNAGGTLGTWLPALIMIGIGVIAWVKFGSASDFSRSSLKPSAGGVSDIVLWSNIAFAFGGLEAASVMGGEVRDARRNIPKALVTAGLMITFIYVSCTVALLAVLPKEQTSGLTGIQDSVLAAGTRVGGEALGKGVASLVGLLQVVAYVGGVGAWMAATARLPFVAGIDRYLPDVFGRIHPKWRTPFVALLVQAGVSALLIFMSQLGSSAEWAYQLLVKLCTISYFIPFLYMFLALIVLQEHPAKEGTIRAPGGKPGAYCAGVIGFLVTAAAIYLACVPETGEQHRAKFYITLFGTMGINLGTGLLLYYVGRRRKLRVES
ncbi:MAG TPA: APC family permease, partial [Blastocatellia bacterium]|nr:APC family permease [Blastocatellia bacterium]